MAFSRKAVCSTEACMELIQAVKEGGCIWNPGDENYKDRFQIALTWRKISQKFDVNERDLRSKWRNLRDTFIKEIKKYKCTSLETYKGRWCFFKPLYFLRKTLTIKMDKKTMENHDDNNYEESDSSQQQSNESGDEYNDYDDNDDNAYPSDIKREVQDMEEVHIEEAEDILSLPESSLKKSRNHYTIEIEEANDVLSLPEPSSKKKRNIETQFQHLDSSNSESRDEDFDEMFLKSLTPYFRQLDPIRKLVLRSRFQDMLMNEIAAQKGKL